MPCLIMELQPGMAHRPISKTPCQSGWVDQESIEEVPAIRVALARAKAPATRSNSLRRKRIACTIVVICKNF